MPVGSVRVLAGAATVCGPCNVLGSPDVITPVMDAGGSLHSDNPRHLTRQGIRPDVSGYMEMMVRESRQLHRKQRYGQEVLMKGRFLAVMVVALVVLAGAAVAAPADRVVTVLEGLKPGNPVKHGNLTVFPLIGKATGSMNYTMLDKAIRKGYVEVQEKDGGDVNTVRIRNKSDKYVFGMAGEMITGAKQNRMLQKDVLLHPKSGWLDLSVYCVEHGRWHGSSMDFSSKALRGFVWVV